MEQIVLRDGDQVFTTSEIIAENAEVEHRSVLQLVGKYEGDLNEFGQVAFEMRPGYNNSQVRIARLNEQQSTLLLTYLRNTETVRAFKKNLVKAFYDMANQLQNAKPQGEELLALAVIEARQVLEAKTKEIEAKTKEIETLTPRAEAWDTFVSATGDYSVEEAAKILSRDDRINIGRNRLFEFMGEIGWLYRWGKRKSWHAYQGQVDNKRIVLRMSPVFQNHKTGELERPAPTVRLTAKGVEQLHHKLLEVALV